jgi:deoxyribonucleoside regulator
VNSDEIRLMVQVCKMYYLEELSQEEIAKHLFISRPQVSKLIKKAKKNNIVSININNPFSQEYLMVNKLKDHYRIKNAVVIDTRGFSKQEALARLAANMSVALTSHVANGNIVGISAGYAAAACSHITNIYNCSDLLFVPLIAGESSSGKEWYASHNCARFAERFEGKYMILNTPLIIREDKVRGQLSANVAVKPVLDCYDKLDAILLGIGQTTLKSTLGQCSISKEEIVWANEHGAKAIIGASFIDAGGNEILQNQSDIFIGIKAKQIKKCKNVIAIALGLDKVEAIKAALKGEYINVLCTDLDTAKELVK